MRRVTVEAPTKSRIEPKLGTVSAMKRRTATERERNRQRFQLKSVKKGDVTERTGIDDQNT